MSIIIDYLEVSSIYQEKYGSKTVILYQVGSFFEIYSFFISKSNEICNITEIENISSICNLNIAKKQAYIGENLDENTIILPFPKNKKDIGSWIKNTPKSEIVMAGFRDYSLDKFVNIITDAGYTAVVYIQDKDTTGKIISRKLDAVHSPGTYISETSSNVLSNNVLSIWVEVIKSSRNPDHIVIGCANINIFTGQSSIFEYETTFHMNPTTFDDLEKFVSEFIPNEALILHNFENDDIFNSFMQYTGISSNIPVHVVNNNIKNEKQISAMNCTKQTYINQIVSSFFGLDYSSAIEFNRNVIATQAFCYLLNFIQEHNPHLVRKISVPLFTNVSSTMVLANHTLRQLNIIDDSNMNSKSSGHLSSVLSFLNRSCTSMGKRNFKYQLLNPTCDVDTLNNEYSITDYILLKNELFIPQVRKALLHIRDIDKINRQIVSNKLNPATLFSLFKTIETILELNSNYIVDDDVLNNYLQLKCIQKNDDVKQITTEFISFINSKFDIQNCQYLNSTLLFDKNIIKPNVSPQLDSLIYRETHTNDNIIKIQSYFNELIKANDKPSNKELEYIKIHETDKTGISFHITKKRSTILKSILNSIKTETLHINEEIKIKVSDIQIVGIGANDQIIFPFLSSSARSLIDIQKQITEIISIIYFDTLLLIENLWYDKLEYLARYISFFDVIVNKAHIAREYKYCKPNISLKQEKSFVDTSGLRHVLIEHIQTNELYVTNDIVLGDDDNKQDGIVLFAVNSSGKTSLIRSLGISIILAQSGCYCPATTFTFKPYKSIFCQIEKNDNLFKNMSTFQAEMNCLRVILKSANENSIILGDELANSTEIQSGISIMVATLIELHETKCSFIIASHFNQIDDYEEIKELTRLKMKHMTIEYDQLNDNLIFNRKLQDGVGMTNYGLSVARSLYMPTTFMDRAFHLRNKYFPNNKGVLSLPTTKYNSTKIKTLCELCNKAVGTEIHHMQQQKDADQNGFIEHFDKNHMANLMSICSKCHDETHKKKIVKIIRRKTTNGYQLKEET
jgi:DNA mismatch repair protein MutS